MRLYLWVAVAIVLFIIGIALGLLLPGESSGIVSDQVSVLGEMARLIGDLPGWAMAVFIFLKNASAIAFGFALSPFFLIVPVFSLVLNGWVIGVVTGEVVSQHSLGYLLVGIVPHGIIELPAFFIGQGAAFMFGIAVMRAVVKREGREELGMRFRQGLKYLGFAVVLLVPAAIIEAFVTPLLLSRFA